MAKKKLPSQTESSTTKTRDLMDNIWTDVTIEMVFLDRGKVMSRELRFSKEEMEAEQTAAAKEDGREVPENYSMPNQMFQSIVMRAASSMFQTPIVAEGTASNEMRLLAPSCVKEVVVRVHNLGQVILA